jgi:hypothetical protein
MLFQGSVGPQSLTLGVQATASLGRGGEVLVSEYQGRYFNLAYQGKVFCSANQSAKALTLLSSTYTGHLIYNPVGSGFNAILLQCAVAVATAPAGISNMHYEGTNIPQPLAPTSVTSNTVTSGMLGQNSTGVSQSYNVATLPFTPTVIRALGGGPNATGSVTTPFIVDDMGGILVLTPGTYLGLGALTTAISVVASFHWAELPV